MSNIIVSYIVHKSTLYEERESILPCFWRSIKCMYEVLNIFLNKYFTLIFSQKKISYNNYIKITIIVMCMLIAASNYQI